MTAALQLKQEFDMVKELHGLLGFGWDDGHKVVTAPADVWEAYLEVSHALPTTTSKVISWTLEASKSKAMAQEVISVI